MLLHDTTALLQMLRSENPLALCSSSTYEENLYLCFKISIFFSSYSRSSFINAMFVPKLRKAAGERVKCQGD